MQGDSDDDINELRTVALLSKPTNMRKRKVTLTNKRKVITGANGGDKREVVRTRQVVVGVKSRSPPRAITVGRTVDNGADTDRSPGTEKKAKLENDERIFSVAEEKESTSILDEKDAKGAGWQSGTGEDGAVNLKGDIRIVVNKNETVDSRSSGEPIVQVAADDVAEEEHVDDEENKIDLEIEKENHGLSDDDGGEDEEEDIASDEHAEPVALGEGEEQQEQEVLQTETDEIADTAGGDTVEKEGKDVSEKDGQDNDLKNDEKQHSHASKSTDKVKKKDTSDNEQLDVKNKAVTKNKDDPLVNGKTPPDIPEQKENNSSEADQANGATSAAGDDDMSSASDSSSSSSGSSSSSSSGSSSSGNSSDSGSTSSSDSGSGSDNEHSPTRKSKSRSVSVSSSSYSYSTGGSTEKKATLRSVVAQTNLTSTQRRRPSRSPNVRRTSRDRRYTARPRSLENRFRGGVIDSERTRRGDEYWHSRRRSPYRKRETGDSRSSQRYYRRGSRDRSPSRERNNPSRERNSPSRERNRPRLQTRMRERSRSRGRDDELPSDPVECKNPLLRKDDDYVEINVEKGQNIKQSAETPKVGRLVEKKTDKQVTKLGFDLRSRLGPKQNEKENAGKQSRGREQQHVRRKARGHELNTSEGEAVEEKSDKELILDARIERIRVQNEEIKKRKEEIEREKLLFG